MAKETQIGSLTIDLKIKLEALEKGLETAKQKIQELEQSNNQIQNSNKGLDASYLAMSATAVASLLKIKSAISDCVEEYTSYTQAMSSLQDVSDYTGESMQDLSGIMNKFSKYMNKSDLAATIKNFTLMGYSAQDTEKMITSLTNSAIKNRNANLSVSEAVKNASDGYKQGLSTLSDSAGVTENLSVMQEKYAKSIGKTASQLTEAEINQAYLNRTMQASEPFAGAMEEYLDSLAGKQGQYSQAMRETQVAYMEALEPTLKKITEIKTGLLNVLGNMIQQNQAATTGITVFLTVVLGLSVAMVAGIKIVQAYKKAIDSLNVSTKALKTTMGGLLVVSSIIAAISAHTTAIQEQEEAQAKLNEVTERYNSIKDGTYEFSQENIAKVQEEKTKIEEQITLMEKKLELEQKIKDLEDDPQSAMPKLSTEQINAMFPGSGGIPGLVKEMNGEKQAIRETTSEIIHYKTELEKTKAELKAHQKANGNFGNSMNELNDTLKENTSFLDDAAVLQNINMALDLESVKTKQRDAAQLKVNTQTMQDYLNIVKKGDKSTSQYQEAVKQLAQAYPEAANAGGIIEEEVQRLIDAEALDAQSKWASAQEKIKAEAAIIQAALNSETVQKQVAQNIGITVDELNMKLQSTLALYNAMAGMQASDVPNITPTSISAPKLSGGSKKVVHTKIKL